MTIKEIHDDIKKLANIGQSQYFTPEDIDGFINDVVSNLYRKDFEHFESTKTISSVLGYFKKSDTIDLSSGQCDLPLDYNHYTEVEAIFTTKTKHVEILSDAKFMTRKGSSAFAPSSDYPIARIIGDNKIEVLPVSATQINLYYLKKPAKAKFGYSISSSGTSFIYNESESTQLDWPEIDHPKIVSKAVTLVGIALRDRGLVHQERVLITENNEGA